MISVKRSALHECFKLLTARNISCVSFRSTFHLSLSMISIDPNIHFTLFVKRFLWRILPLKYTHHFYLWPYEILNSNTIHFGIAWLI